MSKTNIHYIYVYLNPLAPGKYCYPGLPVSFIYEPFYVGKGKHLRMFGHIREAKHRNKTDKHRTILSIISAGINPKDYVLKICDQLADTDAYELEKLYIRSIGRKSIDSTNPLLNIAYGGKWYNNHLSKFSDEEKDEIASLYLEGLSTPQLGRKYSCDHKTICKILKELGVKARPITIADKYSEAFRLEVVAAYAIIKNTLEVSRMFSINSKTVTGILNLHTL